MKTSKIYFVALGIERFSLDDAEFLNGTLFVGYQALAACMNEMGNAGHWEIYDPDALVKALNDGLLLQDEKWLALVTVTEEDEI